MDPLVFIAVLAAAACHAGWNALIKVGLDPLSTTTLISLGAGLVALTLVPLVGVPAWAAWPWLIASVILSGNIRTHTPSYCIAMVSMPGGGIWRRQNGMWKLLNFCWKSWAGRD